MPVACCLSPPQDLFSSPYLATDSPDIVVLMDADCIVHEGAIAKVTGCLPQQQDAAKTQRTRWEHGHLQTLLTQVPQLLSQSVIQRRIDLFAFLFPI